MKALGGDEMTDRRTGRGISDIRTIGIPVVDQEKALAFYVDKLGFETRLDVPMGEGARWIEVAPPDAAITVALIRAHDGLPAGVETGIRFTTPDADTNHADFLARGIDVDDVLRWPGVPAMFAFRDQDGNGLEVVEVPTTQAAGNPSRI
jgi:lactoylglutathione lyase